MTKRWEEKQGGGEEEEMYILHVVLFHPLRYQVRIMTSPKCIRMTRWLVLLQDLIQEAYWQQDDPEIRELIHEWKDEKSVLRKSLKGFYQQLLVIRMNALLLLRNL